MPWWLVFALFTCIAIPFLTGFHRFLCYHVSTTSRCLFHRAPSQHLVCLLVLDCHITQCQVNKRMNPYGATL